MKLDDKIKEKSNKDLQWIKAFSKIKIIDVCRDLKVNKANLWTGKASADSIIKVREEIERRLKELG